MSEYRFKIGDFAPTGSVDRKFRAQGVALHNYFSQKTRINDVSYGIKIWSGLSSVLLQRTLLADRQSDIQTDGQNSHR